MNPAKSAPQRWEKSFAGEIEADTFESNARRDRVRLLASTLARLPARHREVLVLRRIRGLSRRETAQRLGLPEESIEVHAEAAMKCWAKLLRRRGAGELLEDGSD